MSGITFQYTADPFDFKILRKSSNATLFSTYNQSIIFSQYYIEIGTQVDSNFIYGLG
jgi:alpha-glucosidase